MAPPSLKLVVSGLFPAFFFLTPNRHKIWSLIPMSLLSPLLGHLRHHPLLVSLISHKLFLFCLLSWFFFIILSFKYCIVSGPGSHISSLLYSSSSPLTPLVIPSRLGALNSTYTDMVLKRTPPPPTLSWLPTASDQQTPSWNALDSTPLAASARLTPASYGSQLKCYFPHPLEEILVWCATALVSFITIAHLTDPLPKETKSYKKQQSPEATHRKG